MFVKIPATLIFYVSKNSRDVGIISEILASLVLYVSGNPCDVGILCAKLHDVGIVSEIACDVGMLVKIYRIYKAA